MKILIQNTSPTPYFINLMTKQGGTKGLGARVNIESDNAITEVDSSVFEEKIQSHPFFQQLIANGVLVILNNRQIDSAVDKSSVSREIGYSNYKNLMLQIRSVGGDQNPEIAPYLDRDGYPKFNLLRANNFGNSIDMDKANQYKQRYIAELSAGMHEGALKIPGGNLAAASTLVTGENAKVPETKIERVTSEEANELNVEEKVKESEVEYFTQKQLGAMDREQLEVLAKKLDIEFDADTTDKRLISWVFKAQQDDKE